MNRYRVFHHTLYRYSAAVELGPHRLYLRPREGHDLRIESSEIRIQPDALLRWHRDVEGNCVAMASFHGPAADQFSVESLLTVQQYDQEPLDFMVEDYALFHPFCYSHADRPILSAYLATEGQHHSPSLKNWTSTIWPTGASIQSFTLLSKLNRATHELVRYEKREEAGIQTPTETLMRRSGSCRDIAYLFMEAARLYGFACRFVSGYSFTEFQLDEQGSTHAWAEVFLPGAGWKGFDPTRGELVGAHHIPVAVGRLPQSLPPISGSFSGNAELLSLDVNVTVTKL